MQYHSEHEMRSLHILGMFQLLEFVLKVYISASYAIVKQSLDGSIPFEYSYKDVENSPLEKLLNIFAKVNGNTTLQGRLNKLRDNRNNIAHSALLYRHDVIRDLLQWNLEAHVVDLASTEQELDDCLVQVAQELEWVVSKYRDDAA